LKTIRFSGVMPILATPFKDDESLDLAAWTRLLEFMVELGVDGVTLIGVLGESNRLADHERDALISHAVKVIGGRLPIVVGTSHSGTEAGKYLAARAAGLGADAVMITPAREAVPNEERIIEMYQRIAEGLPIPIVLQDHPASSEVQMPVALILRLLREVPAIRCIKAEAVPTAPKLRQIIDGLGDRPLPILTGLGALYAPFDLQAGSAGFNTGFAFPEVLIAMVNAAKAGNWARVHALYARFAALIVFEQQPGVAVRKEILRRRGLLASARARHPGATLSAFASGQLDRLLEQTLPGVDIRRPISV
jgi:4-hydroxy-tetrahydrodipicolinate synthase